MFICEKKHKNYKRPLDSYKLHLQYLLFRSWIVKDLFTWTFNGGIDISGFIKNIYTCVLKIKYFWDWGMRVNYVNDDRIFICVIWHPLIKFLWFCLYFVLSGDWQILGHCISLYGQQHFGYCSKLLFLCSTEEKKQWTLSDCDDAFQRSSAS